MPEKFIAGEMSVIKKELVTKLFGVWAIYFIAACGLFCLLIWLVVSVLSWHITDPINKLNQKIKLNILSVQELKKSTNGSDDKKVQFSIENFAKGFIERNHEMN